MKHFGRGTAMRFNGSALYRKKTSVRLWGPQPEPFTCDSREHDGLEGQAGDYVAADGHGGFYPISAAFFSANYEALE